MQEKILSDQAKMLAKQRGLFLILTLMLGFICCGLTLKLITTRDKTILVPYNGLKKLDKRIVRIAW